jgi:hypothetical protein
MKRTVSQTSREGRQQQITALLRVVTEGVVLLSPKRGPHFKTHKYLGKNKNMAMSPNGTENNNNCAGECQQQITALHPGP